MREQWARRLAIITGLVIVGLSALIATRFDAGAGDSPPTGRPDIPVVIDMAKVTRGAEVFAAEGCAGCHSVAGQGNPRNPLDGVGTRLDAEALLHWTIGASEVADRMPRRIAMTKQSYADLDETDLDALVAYLKTL